MRRAALILLLLVTTSCVTTTPVVYTLEYDKTIWPSAKIEHAFWSIYFEWYIRHEYDCSNKCSKLIDIMDKDGIVGDVVILDVDYDATNHAVVRASINGTYVYYDPANGKTTKKLEDFGVYLSVLPSNQIQFFNRLGMSEWTF